MSKASLADTQAALNAVAGKSGFRCVPVSWEDAQRGTVGGTLSCWGGNISDVRLWKKGGQLLYTLRTENWNERLGYVSTKDVAVVVGNEVPGGAAPTPVTLETYLKSIGRYGAYAGIKTSNLYQDGVDGLATIRFQSVFLPIADSEVTEFCTEVYNYNTHGDDDPRNMTLLCTAQGTNAQQDGSGAQRVYLHAVDTNETVHRYWMEAERSKHTVGGAQLETEDEAKEAASRGKATSIHIGTRAMGTRFNVQMLIQVPLKQKEQPPARTALFAFGGSPNPNFLTNAMCFSSGCYPSAQAIPMSFGCSAIPCPPPCPPPCPSSAPCLPGRAAPPQAIGTSNAARVSRGTEFDEWHGVNNKSPERDPSQHATITVTMYYTVAGGIPSVADIEACVKDLDDLYKACPSDKKLVDCSEVTAELTVKDMNDIVTKVTSQPYKPATFAPTKSSFPE